MSMGAAACAANTTSDSGRFSPGSSLRSPWRKTEGLSFAQLREIYVLGAQSAFEQGRAIGLAGVIKAVDSPANLDGSN